MVKRYSILKGTVSQLQIIDDPKEIGSNNVGLIAMIGALITGAFGVAAALLTTLSVGSITLQGKHFSCYVGRKFVEGKLIHIRFNNGDYVEMVVDKSDDNNQYQSYAVRIPKTHALYFPRSVSMPTLLGLKYSSIISGVLCLIPYLIFLILLLTDLNEDFFFNFTLVTLTIFFWFFVFTTIIFLLIGGRYSFIGNRIFATLGYPKPWSHDTSVEHERFKKLNRSGDPELYDDPQTPEFERIKIRDAKATYYCRTPIIPDWVEVIDERGFTPDIDNQPPKLNHTEQ
ncbi:hypothetical protein J3U21_10730 [Gilliamella sp. B2776]|uniref:hypothetical protein n=2 Tax=Gilliamella TaxID=1193503 RepID=UPI002269E5D7|nr:MULTISPECIES: hypothetical protein [unclassified Gilliamella]MCX8650777.1 hypothetical protein [Gilliamella sp. B2779]MCX8692625.1 hypothetical protein [Gilliamella sp. B2776]MCX8703738.1 hypothetical protein [Gilliamella sp. B2781]WDM18563.1 hypothetical protein J4T76_10710 [Gilliamella sp. B3022]